MMPPFLISSMPGNKTNNQFYWRCYIFLVAHEIGVVSRKSARGKRLNIVSDNVKCCRLPKPVRKHAIFNYKCAFQLLELVGQSKRSARKRNAPKAFLNFQIFSINTEEFVEPALHSGAFYSTNYHGWKAP